MSLREFCDREDHGHFRALEDKLDHVLERLETMQHQLKEITMSQADVDAAVTALQADETGLDASVQAIQAEIAALNGQGVNTDALTAEVNNLQAHVASVAALAPAPPA